MQSEKKKEINALVVAEKSIMEQVFPTNFHHFPSSVKVPQQSDVNGDTMAVQSFLLVARLYQKCQGF